MGPPARGDRGRGTAAHRPRGRRAWRRRSPADVRGVIGDAVPISPLVGEMPGRAEGGAVPLSSPGSFRAGAAILLKTSENWLKTSESWRSFTPPSVIGDAVPISPTRGEIGSVAIRAFLQINRNSA
ncbi:MAG: hypothetical protein EOS29_30470 [Mesorhizobium sp.]|nr:MAG: hypothetical protein EOS29_30470 [Mesorhizobium sp.]